MGTKKTQPAADKKTRVSFDDKLAALLASDTLTPALRSQIEEWGEELDNMEAKRAKVRKTLRKLVGALASMNEDK